MLFFKYSKKKYNIYRFQIFSPIIINDETIKIHFIDFKPKNKYDRIKIK